MLFPLKKISASSINAYLSCPLGFKLTAIDGLIMKEGPALELGSMFDLMFKLFHQKLPVEEIYEQTKSKFFSKVPTKQQIKNFGVARNLIENYKTKSHQFYNPKFDIGFGINISEIVNRDIKLTGYLDALDITPIGVIGKEVKTCGKTGDWNQERVDKEIQSKIYRYYLHKEYNIELPKLQYIVFNKDTFKKQEFTCNTKPGEFEGLFETIKGFISDVEAEKFKRNPNHPFYCPCRQLS